MRLYPVWQIAYHGVYESVYEALLQSRQLTAAALATSADGLHSPQLLTDLDRAVERLGRALEGGEKIIVYGDYDVDGVTSTALMLDFLERVGADVGHILPNRFSDGYGVREAGIERALSAGAKLLVTVDNGISAFEALALARQQGLDVVVIDHHRQTGPLPPAHSVVNPNRTDCSYPFKGLAGVGVTFKVVQALSEQYLSGEERRSYLNSLLDLVALGSVADLAPVLDENRVLIQRGMKVLEQTERVGLRCLKESARCDRGPLKTGAVGFYLGPRLNSAGRMASPDLALDLVRCGDAVQAEYLAAELEKLNSQRRQLQRAGAQEATAAISPDELESDRLLVVLGEGWHLGVIGLIAGALADLHSRPAVICTDARGDGMYVGSARSIEAYDIVQGISECADFLETYGGHSAAAGFSLQAERFEEFRACLIDHANARLTDRDLQPELQIDLCLRAEDIGLATLDALSRLEPFGKGHEPPRFVCRDLQIADCRRVGAKGVHLKLALKTGSHATSAMWWNKGELAKELVAGDRVAVAFELEVDTFADYDTAQMMIRDMYLTGEEDPGGGVEPEPAALASAAPTATCTAATPGVER